MPLEDFLRSREPAVQFVSKRHLQKLLEDLPNPRLLRNTERSWWIGERLLLTPPDDRGFFGHGEPAIERYYLRLLFRAAVCRRAEERRAETMAFWSALSFGQQREVEFVLRADGAVPEAPTAEELAPAFAERFLDLHEYEPRALPFAFPLVAVSEEAIASIRASLNVDELRDQFAFSPAAPTSEVAEPTSKVSASALQEAEAWRARGNFVKAAAVAYGNPLAVECTQSLIAELAPILQLPDDEQHEWQHALNPMVAAASVGRWPREKRALYELQRLATDFKTPLDAVAPIDWILALGRKPLLRPLEPVRDVIILRRLRAALRHVQSAELSGEPRHHVEELFERAIQRIDPQLRAKLGPVIERAFEQQGFRPGNLPERIARDRIVAELLDRLSENGFLRLGDLRDAIARNDLKLRDCTLKDFFAGDVLLAIDKQLHDDLFGVYHRGEIYLRGIQRFSSLAFGTVLGRWLTLFVAIPFGGAFLAVEAAKHIGHAIAKLVELIATLIVQPATIDDVPHEKHELSLDSGSLLAMGVLGVVLFLLINVPPVRRLALRGASLLGFGLRSTLVALPQTVWRSSPVRFLLENTVTRFISRFILWPTLIALLIMLAIAILAQSIEVMIAGGAASFIMAMLAMASPWGRQLREDAIESFHDFGRRLLTDILPGMLGGIMEFFRSVLGLVERILYAIDEWFRYREGQSKPSLALKVILGLAWFPLAYIVRFAFYLLIEPQVNPIKHFPVVTVSHKVLLPLIPTLSELLEVSEWTAGLLISGIPGIFGFLVWEFKENWKLYASNRSPKLRPVMLGHHGETLRGLLRPGFHSGTVPKLFRRLRRLYTKPADAPPKTDRLQHEEHHLHLAIERLIERNLFAYWHTVPTLNAMHASLLTTRLGVQRVEIAIGAADSHEPLRLSFENFNGTIVGTVDDPGWTQWLSTREQAIVRESLQGLFAAAAVSASGVTWHSWVEFWKS